LTTSDPTAGGVDNDLIDVETLNVFIGGSDFNCDVPVITVVVPAIETAAAAVPSVCMPVVLGANIETVPISDIALVTMTFVGDTCAVAAPTVTLFLVTAGPDVAAAILLIEDNKLAADFMGGNEGCCCCFIVICDSACGIELVVLLDNGALDLSDFVQAPKPDPIAIVDDFATEVAFVSGEILAKVKAEPRGFFIKVVVRVATDDGDDRAAFVNDLILVEFNNIEFFEGENTTEDDVVIAAATLFLVAANLDVADDDVLSIDDSIKLIASFIGGNDDFCCCFIIAGVGVFGIEFIILFDSADLFVSVFAQASTPVPIAIAVDFSVDFFPDALLVGARSEPGFVFFVIVSLVDAEEAVTANNGDDRATFVNVLIL